MSDRPGSPGRLFAYHRDPGEMPLLRREDSFRELDALMELRLAFGPGTRLWAWKSCEDLCYDWLHYKACRETPSFREFAVRCYAWEKQHEPSCPRLAQLLRRVALVLRAHHIPRPPSEGRSMSTHLRPHSRAIPAQPGRARDAASGNGPRLARERVRQPGDQDPGLIEAPH